MTSGINVACVRTSDVVNHHRFLCLVTTLCSGVLGPLYTVKIGSEVSERIPI